MSLTLEDGTGVAGADSYATLVQVRAYATGRGLTLPADDALAEITLRQAFDYIESQDPYFKGSRAVATQPNSWPRQNVYLFGNMTALALTFIPDQLIKAQCQLACDAASVTLQPTGTGQEVIVEKVDVIETHYAQSGSGTVRPELNKALAILGPLLINGGGFGLRSYRV